MGLAGKKSLNCIYILNATNRVIRYACDYGKVFKLNI